MVDSVLIEKVIVVETTRGSGDGPNDPIRKITEYWSKEGGKLLACFDSFAPRYNESIGGWDLQETDLVQVDGIILGTGKEIKDAVEASVFVEREGTGDKDFITWKSFS